MLSVHCPGCLREIPVAEDELGAIVITCAGCERRFVPERSAPAVRSGRGRMQACAVALAGLTVLVVGLAVGGVAWRHELASAVGGGLTPAITKNAAPAAKAAKPAPTDAELAAHPFWRGQVRPADVAGILRRLAHPGAGARKLVVFDDGAVGEVEDRRVADHFVARHVVVEGCPGDPDRARRHLKMAMDAVAADEDYRKKFGD